MKKTLLLLCLCALSFRGLCQQFDLGIIAGPNVSTFIPPASQEPGGVIKYSALAGFHAGVIFQVAVGSIYIQPGMVYETIGGKLNAYDDDFGGGPFSLTSSLQYLQVPLNILYHTKSGKFFFGGGPYVAFGISGNVTHNTTSGSATYKFVFSGSNNPEFGLNLIGGVRVPGNFIFTAGASFAEQNKVYNLSIGRMFW